MVGFTLLQQRRTPLPFADASPTVQHLPALMPPRFRIALQTILEKLGTVRTLPLPGYGEEYKAHGLVGTVSDEQWQDFVEIAGMALWLWWPAEKGTWTTATFNVLNTLATTFNRPLVFSMLQALHIDHSLASPITAPLFAIRTLRHLEINLHHFDHHRLAAFFAAVGQNSKFLWELLIRGEGQVTNGGTLLPHEGYFLPNEVLHPDLPYHQVHITGLRISWQGLQVLSKCRTLGVLEIDKELVISTAPGPESTQPTFPSLSILITKAPLQNLPLLFDTFAFPVLRRLEFVCNADDSYTSTLLEAVATHTKPVFIQLQIYHQLSLHSIQHIGQMQSLTRLIIETSNTTMTITDDGILWLAQCLRNLKTFEFKFSDTAPLHQTIFQTTPRSISFLFAFAERLTNLTLPITIPSVIYCLRPDGLQINLDRPTKLKEINLQCVKALETRFVYSLPGFLVLFSDSEVDFKYKLFPEEMDPGYLGREFYYRLRSPVARG